jgi:ketosteroid isomerase-like protein
MKRSILAAAVLASFSAGFAQETSKAVESELISLDKSLAAAEAKGDVAAVGQILADDYVFTDQTGRTGGKAETLENIRARTAPHRGSIAADNYSVRLFGETAVMTHMSRVKSADDADAFETLQSLHVWLKRNGRWQIVAHQWTTVAFPQLGKKPFLRADCARYSFEPEVRQYFGDSDAVLRKLDVDEMGLSNRTGYILMIETKDTAELAMFDRVSFKDDTARVARWEGRSAAELRERLTNLMLQNRGIACIGQQSKALVKASLSTQDLGAIPVPVSARAAFGHFVKKYGPEYLRVTAFLLC